MRNYADFNDFLTPGGRGVYEFIKKHVTDNGTWSDSYILELSVLANALDVYRRCADYCNKNGISMTFETEKGTYSQVRPEYTAMKTEYGNIQKHAPKFGLNPADLGKIFGEVKKAEVKKGFDTGPMRVAK